MRVSWNKNTFYVINEIISIPFKWLEQIIHLKFIGGSSCIFDFDSVLSKSQPYKLCYIYYSG